MVSNRNETEKVKCPVEDCNEEVVKRGLFMHIFQTDDAEGEGHYSRYTIPDDIDPEDIKVTGKEEVEIDYPEEQDLENLYYLDTYTGKAYEGKRGLMIHLSHSSGKNNIPSDVTERHDADDFPIVDVDTFGNITEVIKWPEGDVPPLEPYLPWYDDDDSGYVSKRKIREFTEQLRKESGAATADAIEEALLW